MVGTQLFDWWAPVISFVVQGTILWPPGILMGTRYYFGRDPAFRLVGMGIFVVKWHLNRHALLHLVATWHLGGHPALFWWAPSILVDTQHFFWWAPGILVGTQSSFWWAPGFCWPPGLMVDTWCLFWLPVDVLVGIRYFSGSPPSSYLAT